MVILKNKNYKEQVEENFWPHSKSKFELNLKRQNLSDAVKFSSVFLFFALNDRF